MKAIKTTLAIALFILGLVSCTPQTLDDTSDNSPHIEATGGTEVPVDDDRDE